MTLHDILKKNLNINVELDIQDFTVLIEHFDAMDFDMVRIGSGGDSHLMHHRVTSERRMVGLEIQLERIEQIIRSQEVQAGQKGSEVMAGFE